MADCIFCAIAERRAPASLVCEDENSLALLDLHPITRGHTLVIPRLHYENIYDIPDGLGDAVMRTAIKVARALRDELQPDGMNLLQSNGRAAGQTVFHFHIHIVPRWKRDNLFLPPHAVSEVERASLDELAAVLRQRL